MATRKTRRVLFVATVATVGAMMCYSSLSPAGAAPTKPKASPAARATTTTTVPTNVISIPETFGGKFFGFTVRQQEILVTSDGNGLFNKADPATNFGACKHFFQVPPDSRVTFDGDYHKTRYLANKMTFTSWCHTYFNGVPFVSFYVKSFVRHGPGPGGKTPEVDPFVERGVCVLKGGLCPFVWQERRDAR